MNHKTMDIRDCYIRLTDPNGKHVVNYHRIWDFDLFIESQHKTYERAVKPEDRRTVIVCDEADYVAFVRNGK